MEVDITEFRVYCFLHLNPALPQAILLQYTLFVVFELKITMS